MLQSLIFIDHLRAKLLLLILFLNFLFFLKNKNSCPLRFNAATSITLNHWEPHCWLLAGLFTHLTKVVENYLFHFTNLY